MSVVWTVSWGHGAMEALRRRQREQGLRIGREKPSDSYRELYGEFFENSIAMYFMLSPSCLGEVREGRIGELTGCVRAGHPFHSRIIN